MIDFNTAPSQDEAETHNCLRIVQPDDEIESFRALLARHGLFPDEIIPDGQIHRFGRNLNSYYSLHAGKFHHGIFGSWEKDGGIGVKYCSGNVSEMSAQDLADHERILSDNRTKLKAIKKKKNKQAQVDAQKLWDSSPNAVTHPYLQTKRVGSYGLKVSGGELLIPMRDDRGVLWSLQRITDKKLFFPGGKVAGCSHTIDGDINNLYLCEGYSTGATIHEATGGMVIVAFNAGNLKNMIPLVGKGNSITICADNDRKHKDLNPGIKAAREAAKKREIGCNVIWPIFKSDSTSLSDFNDLAASEGIDAVKKQLKSKVEFPPQGKQQTRLLDILIKPVKSRNFILNYNDQGFLPEGIVGTITATGGTGKSYLLAQLAFVLASGGSLGILNAPKPMSTLFIAGEDDTDEMSRRFWNIKGNRKFPSELFAVSTIGEVGPLMKLDGNNPVMAEGFHWLRETIKLHDGLEVVILDPKSRFFGLDENNNDHCTRWIQTLEKLQKEYKLTILFSHHTSKASSETISQNMSRGGGAIVDGCRWQAGMVRLDPNKAAEFGIENSRLYVELNTPKSNYSPDIPESLYFKRNQYGVLVPVNLEGEIYKEVSNLLHGILARDNVEYSRRDLEKTSSGKEIRDYIKDQFPTFNDRKMPKLLDYMIDKKMIQIVKTNKNESGRPRFIVKIIDQIPGDKVKNRDQVPF